MQRAQLIGLGIVFVWFMGGGIGHFVATAFFVNIAILFVGYH